MAYKSILTVVTGPEAPQLATAVDIARAEDAHRESLTLGVEQTRKEE